MDTKKKANYEYVIVTPDDTTTNDKQTFTQVHTPLPSLATARVVVDLIQQDWVYPLAVVVREKK